MKSAKRGKAKKRPVPFLETEPVHRTRLWVVTTIFFAVFLAIAGRSIMFQVDPDLRFNDEDLKHIGQIQIHRPRGRIMDTRGRVLATDRDVPSLAVNPSKVEDPVALAHYLAPRLGMDQHVLMAKFSRRSKSGGQMRFVWLKRRMDKRAERRLGDLDAAPDSSALTLRQEAIRYYPDKQLAAQVLGFANLDGKGVEGIEFVYDSYLRSKSGRRISRVDNRRNFLGFRTIEYEAPTGGDDAYLTIDSALQFTLERELDAAMHRNNASGAMGILMDPRTGAVLAMATIPSFDPNRYGKFEPEQRKNRAIVDVFEPGSSFKIVTAAAALEHGLVTKTSEIDCMNGKFTPYGHTIRDTHPLGVVPFTTCFAQSSNIAMIKVAALLGEDRMETWIRRFGFGARTGIDLPKESVGIFRPVERWSRLSMGSLPMGQEIAVTMTQLARSYSVIANGGLLVEPYLVEKIVSREGEVRYRHERREPQRVLSEDTAAIVRELCHLVVTVEGGTGRRAAIEEFRVGGKTGTAQIAKPDHTGYYRDRYTTIFAGFAPVSDPRLVCVIVVQEPMILNHYGGYVCGPVFKEVMREALVRLDVPRDPMRRESDSKDPLGDMRQDADTVGGRVDLALLEPADEDALELVGVAEDTSDRGPTLPNFRGMTKREAKAKAVELGIPWDPQGAGRVIHQEPPAGTPLSEVQLCRLVFAGHQSD